VNLVPEWIRAEVAEQGTQAWLKERDTPEAKESASRSASELLYDRARYGPEVMRAYRTNSTPSVPGHLYSEIQKIGMRQWLESHRIKTAKNSTITLVKNHRKHQD
jgi:hypothetical protein